MIGIASAAPDVSIVIPTFNRCAWLERLLRALNLQSGSYTYEVVVCVDGSTDGTLDMLAAIAAALDYPLQVLEQTNSGPAAARNRAVRAARGDLLIFLDDDVVPADDFISEHVRVHAGSADLVALGPILPPPGRLLTPWALYEAQLLSRHYAALGAGHANAEPRFFFTGNASVRRADALAIGGFDETFRRGEDVEFGYRLAERGLRYAYVAGAIVYHESDHAYPDWIRIPYQYGRQDVTMALEYGRALALEHAFRAWPTRHVFTRMVAHLAVGHPDRMRALQGSFRWLITRRSGWIPARLQTYVCSTAFNLMYWQGVADATDSGAQVWHMHMLLTASREAPASNHAAITA